MSASMSFTVRWVLAKQNRFKSSYEVPFDQLGEAMDYAGDIVPLHPAELSIEDSGGSVIADQAALAEYAARTHRDAGSYRFSGLVA